MSKETQTSATSISDEDSKRKDNEKDISPHISIGSIDKTVKHMPTELPFGGPHPNHSLTK